MKKLLIPVLAALLLIILPIGCKADSRSFLAALSLRSEPASNSMLVTIAPADGYMPSEDDIYAAAAVIENHLDDLNIMDYTMDINTQNGYISFNFSRQAGNVDFTPEDILFDKSEVKFVDPEGNLILKGTNIYACGITYDESTGNYLVSLNLDEEGTERFAEATAKYTGQAITIYADEQVISSPVVEEAIPNGHAVIKKVSSLEDAKAIAGRLMEGMLPYAIVLADPVGQVNP